MYAHPGRVLAAHWLNPAFLVPLVEVAYEEWTEDDVLRSLMGFLEALGKVPVALKSRPGFIVPRIQVAAMNEAVRMVEEGVASPELIDTAIKAGFGFRLAVLGLLEFIDLGGVDILSYAGTYLAEALGHEHLRPPGLVQQMVNSGSVGPRGGRGFYDYGSLETDELFRDRYRAFVDLLRAYETSATLDFRGGVRNPDKSPLGKGLP
jgi:3-hydroxybutyryl-CoA dehydrogenase